MSDTQRWKPRANPWLVAIIVTLGAFMEVLDTTIVNVSLPHIAGSLSTRLFNAMESPGLREGYRGPPEQRDSGPGWLCWSCLTSEC